MPVLASRVHPRKLVSWSMLEEGVGNAQLMFTLVNTDVAVLSLQ